MNTPAPTLNGKSSALQFLEDHDHLERELVLARDEIAHLKEQVVQATNMAEILHGELENQKQITAQERARANGWLAHTMQLLGQDGAIEAILSTRRRTAGDAAREAAAQGLVETAKMSEADETEMRRIADNSKPERPVDRNGRMPTNQMT